MKKHTRLKDRGLLLRLLIGILVAVVSLLVCSFLAALAVNTTDDPLRYASVGALASLLVSSAASALIITRLFADGGYMMTLLSSLSFCAILILSSLITSGVGAMLRAALSSACYVAIALLASRLSVTKGGRRRKA